MTEAVTKQKAKLRLWRILAAVCGVFLAAWLSYLLWQPGLDVRDGRHDRGRNGIWIAHGWLGGDEWFTRNAKTNEFQKYRDPRRIQELAERLRLNHITDVFPHLCPAGTDGRLPEVDVAQVERFLDGMVGFKVMPWIGGPSGGSVSLQKPEWRTEFAGSVRNLLQEHPRLAGVHINVEPVPSGDPDFLKLLEEIRGVLPKEKLLSISAYPPPTRWHPYPDVHWDEQYFRQVARRSDQLAVMMYDAGQRLSKPYQNLMADWTQEILSWSEGKDILLGVPTYDDAGVGYHDPKLENLTNALLGIHRGLSRASLPTNYQGVAIYCDWETSPDEWVYFREHFLNRNNPAK